jgi:SAM-dependent methyltransferase
MIEQASSKAELSGRTFGADRLRQLRSRWARLREWSLSRWRYVPERAQREDWEAAYSAGTWEQLRDVTQLAHYSQIVGYCTYFKAGGSILDIGCGEGLVQEKLRPYGYRRYIGIDLADEAIRRAAHKQDERTEFVRADAVEFEPAEAFDIIIFNECLYYFVDPIEVLRKYERWLRDDGVFIVSMYGVERTERLWRLIVPLYRCEDGVQVTHDGGKFWTIRVLRPERR